MPALCMHRCLMRGVERPLLLLQRCTAGEQRQRRAELPFFVVSMGNLQKKMVKGRGYQKPLKFWRALNALNKKAITQKKA